MLIHIVPSIYLGHDDQLQACYLSDLTINELGLKLFGEKDLGTRRPYPNKQFHVACRKKGQKAMNGILIDAAKLLRSFTVETRWIVSWGMIDYPATLLHRCTYNVLDSDFDAVTGWMPLWYCAMGPTLGEWSSRWPEGSGELIPMRAMPRMDLWDAVNGGLERQGDVNDVVRNGKVIKRTETFLMPTVEPERLNSYSARSHRIPGLDLAIKV